MRQPIQTHPHSSEYSNDDGLSAEPSGFSRLTLSVAAACVCAAIALEPLVIHTPRGLQAFQLVFVVWFWVLLMFGSTHPSARDRQ